MIAALTCAAAALMAPQANKGPEIFNKMLQRYYAANTVKGTFELVQSLSGGPTTTWGSATAPASWARTTRTTYLPASTRRSSRPQSTTSSSITTTR